MIRNQMPMTHQRGCHFDSYEYQQVACRQISLCFFRTFVSHLQYFSLRSSSYDASCRYKLRAVYLSKCADGSETGSVWGGVYTQARNPRSISVSVKRCVTASGNVRTMAHCTLWLTGAFDMMNSSVCMSDGSTVADTLLRILFCGTDLSWLKDPVERDFFMTGVRCFQSDVGFLFCVHMTSIHTDHAIPQQC